jgi:uncharacterized protein YbjQ (UPF0145 family)
MKKPYLLIFAFISLFSISASSGICQQETKKIVYTTLDVKQNYEIIQIIAATEDIIGASGLRYTAVEKAYNATWEKLMKTAETVGADAVVGVRVEMENMNSEFVGRILIYGTAVKYIE